MTASADARELLEVALEAARVAGGLLVDRFGGPRREVASKSTPTDLVSEADLAAEAAIRSLLDEHRADDAVMGEEGADRPGSTGLRWIVDPLDGTINFLFGLPQWCVSVACEDAAGTLAGVVHDPLRDETFTATRADEPRLNGAPIAGSGREELATALVATGFGYDATIRSLQAPIVARALPRVRDIRRLGSAALDLAWTACGRYDAYYEYGTQPWDVAAGALVCQRAGVTVGPLPAAGGLQAGIIAAAPAIADDLRALVTP